MKVVTLKEKSLFKKIKYAWNHHYQASDINRFKAIMRDVLSVENISKEDREKFFKIKSSDIINIFSRSIDLDEDSFYKKLWAINQERYLIPRLTLIAKRVSDPEYLGASIKYELQKKKNDNKYWLKVYNYVRNTDEKHLGETVLSMLKENSEKPINDFTEVLFNRAIFKGAHISNTLIDRSSHT